MTPAGVVRKDDTFMGVRTCLSGKKEVKGRREGGRGRRRESIYICSTEVELCDGDGDDEKTKWFTTITGHGM